jgi:hypothetical protein
MTDIWPWWISALLAFWSWVSFRRQPASPRAEQIRTKQWFCAWYLAVSGRSPYLSASLTAVVRPPCHGPWSALMGSLAGERERLRSPAALWRRGQMRVPVCSLFGFLAKSLPREPDWGRFVWEFEAVGARLRAFSGWTPSGSIPPDTVCTGLNGLSGLLAGTLPCLVGHCLTG